MAYQFPLNGGRINASMAGNTANAGTLISTGTMYLSGGNNITLSQNGNSIGISGANLTQSNQTLAFSAGSNTSLTSAGTFDARSMYINAHGLSAGFSQSSMFLSAHTTYAGSNHSHGNPTLALTNLSGTTASASNGLTLSLSAAAPGGGGGGIALSASNATFTSGTVKLTNAGAGALTIGTAAQEINFSVPAVSSLSATGALSISSNGNTVSIGVPYQTVNFSAGSNTSLTSAGTFDARSMYINAHGLSAGFSQSSMFLSAHTTYAGSNHSHGNPTLALTNLSGTTASASNGLTLSLSAAAPGGGGGGIALANSQTTYTSGTANLNVAGGAMTIASTTGQSYNFSVPAVSSLSATGAVSISTNNNTISIGAPAISNLSATGAISLSTNGNVVSIGAPAGVTYSYFNPQDAYVQATGSHGQATLHMQPAKVPNVAFDRIAMPVYYTNASNSTASVTASFWFGAYTRTSGSFSLASSTSMSTNWVGSGNVNASIQNGIRLLTIGTTGTMLEDQYYFGIISRTTAVGGNATFQQLVASQQNSSFSGIMGQASNASIQYTRGLGYYSASTTGLPNSIAMSQLRGNSSMALRQPLFYFVNSTF